MHQESGPLPYDFVKELHKYKDFLEEKIRNLKERLFELETRLIEVDKEIYEEKLKPEEFEEECKEE